MKQRRIPSDEAYAGLRAYLTGQKAKKIFLVCGQSFSGLRIAPFFDRLERQTGICVTKFQKFGPNPQYGSVVEGVRRFRESGSDFIVAVGGGSAMDVAKCIKLFSGLSDEECYLKQRAAPNDIGLLAIPTTAGSGSEATKFAVVYFEGEKQSVSEESCMPQAVLLDARLLETLPPLQRTATALDALCHAVESFWSVHATEESKRLSKAALGLILKNWDAYLLNDGQGNQKMLHAAHLAGQAINLAQTTAGHAMCYQLTSRYGLPHGCAAALCLSKAWLYMVSHPMACRDARGEPYLRKTLAELAEAMGQSRAEEAAKWLDGFVKSLRLPLPEASPREAAWLRDSVNQARLRNHPVRLDADALELLYRQILQLEEEG